jgi:hypothetical protein
MADAPKGKSGSGKNMGDRRHVGGPRPIAASVQPVASRALGRRSLAERGLLSEWPEIVGAEVARHCLPRKLAFPRRNERRDGVLTLRVEPGWALELQHLSPQVIERVNGYFGYPAVAQLKFQQGPVRQTPKTERKSPRSLNREEQQALDSRTRGLANRRLSEALNRLGRNVLGRR